MKIRLKDAKEALFPCDALILLVTEEDGIKPYKELDKPLGGVLSGVMASGEFRANEGETHQVHTIGKIKPKSVLLVGLGNKKDAGPEALRRAGGKAASYMYDRGLTESALSTALISALKLNPLDFIEGALLSDYKFLSYKKEDKKALKGITVLNPKGFKHLSSGITSVSVLADAVRFARDLVNTPSNDMTPSALLRAAKSLKGKGVSVGVIDRKEAARLGMGAYLSVAKGSDEPPKFIVVKYRGSGSPPAALPVALIGKSITFDSGGISLKPADGMEKMKYDMAGGAAVLGAIKAASEMGLPVNIVGILPATENLPGGHASKPGDVVRAIGGKTIEIINTDAEGRLALADALGYAMRFKPKAAIDIATLTGACSVALGNEAMAMMGNDVPLMERLEAASRATGERVWRMPLYDEYKEYIKSDIADLKNSGGRSGSLVTAGYFLKEFSGDVPWAHLDIAGTAWADKDKPYCPKGATGIGVRLIVAFLKELGRS